MKHHKIATVALFSLVCALSLPATGRPWQEKKSEEQGAAQKDQKEQKEEKRAAQKDQKEEKGDEFTEDDKMTPAEREALEKKACPTVNSKFDTDTDKKQHPTPEPPPDKAMIYVLRPTMWGNKIQTKLGVDGKWVGVNRGNNYFYFTLDPGEHYFCSQAENHSLMVRKVEAGKTYYFQQKVKMGFMKARNKLVVSSDEEGKSALAKTHLSTWKEKGGSD